MKKQVFILSGISGSGKSTMRNKLSELPNSKIISSDDIREEFNYNWKKDRKADKTFQKMNELYKEYCSDLITENIIIDATSLTKKRRRSFYSQKNDETKIHVILIFSSFLTSQQRIRERNTILVSDKDLKTQLKALDPPIIGVDCDSFEVTGECFFDKKKLFKLIDKKNFFISTGLITDVMDLHDCTISNIKKYELNGLTESHNSSFHLESISEHINLTIKNSNTIDLKVIGLFHDLGKPLYRMPAGPWSSFKGHQKFGAIMYLNLLYMISGEKSLMFTENDKIMQAIYYHMTPFDGITNKFIRTKNISKEILDLLFQFNKIDIESSISEMKGD